MRRRRVGLYVAVGSIFLALVIILALVLMLARRPAAVIVHDGAIPASLTSRPEARLYYPGAKVVAITGNDAYCYQGPTDGGWVEARLDTTLETAADPATVLAFYDEKLRSLGWPSKGPGTSSSSYYRGAWPPTDAYSSGEAMTVIAEGPVTRAGVQLQRYRTLFSVGGQPGASACPRNH